VAGDVTVEEVKGFAEATYGKVPRMVELGPRKRPQEPEPSAVRHVVHADARVTQPSMQRSYLVPSEHGAKPGEAEAIDVLSHILGSGHNSRLHRRLVEERRIAISAGSHYSGTAVDATRFTVYATPQASTTLPDLEAAIDGVIAEIFENGVSEQELTRAKTRLIADSVYGMVPRLRPGSRSSRSRLGPTASAPSRRTPSATRRAPGCRSSVR
jgi:zinc protease